MMLTFEKLIPGYDAANQTTFINVMEGIALSPGMDNLPEWDTHILNQEMIEALKVYCANEADKTKTNILSGVAEKYKRPLKILGNSMQNTGYSLMLYSISAGYWKNAIVYGGNGANAFNIVAGNTLTTDLVTLDSVTEIALQNAMLNSTAVLTAAGSVAVLNNNLALSVLQNDIAGLNEYTKNALKGDTSTLSGQWKTVNENMSDFSRAYQKQITGQEGMAWIQNGVKFDGMKDGVLLDAKGKYAQFIDKSTGEFYEWFSGKDSLIAEARR